MSGGPVLSAQAFKRFISLIEKNYPGCWAAISAATVPPGPDKQALNYTPNFIH